MVLAIRNFASNNFFWRFDPNSPRNIFKTEIDAWLQNPLIKGNKELAVLQLNRVLKKRNITTLNLSGLQISSIPSCIQFLPHLRNLDLNGNKLEQLPQEIGSLVSLTSLWLGNNRLSDLPPTIIQLGSLTTLDLGFNNFKVCPPEIFSLFSLQVLNLRNNQLTVLPTMIGQLQELGELNLSFNRNISSLPLSLGDVHLFTLDTLGTSIPTNQIKSLLRSCASQRNCATAVSKLVPILRLWLSYSKEDHDLTFATQVKDKEKQIIYEWLGKLALTQEFSRNQQTLAKNACNMLETLQSHEEFRTFFFDQVNTNNVHCGDRAAMAFNELYTQWRILTLAPSTPMKEKLILLEGFAKTCALRNAVRKRIIENEIKMGAQERESAEIYFYYETALQKKLNLLIAIKSMAHEEIGKREWINSDELEEEVTATYIDIVVEMPLMSKLIGEDRKFTKKLALKEEAVLDSMETLFEGYNAPDNTMSEEQYLSKSKKILKRRTRLIHSWMAKHLE